MFKKLLGLDLIELYVYPHKYEFEDWRKYDGKDIPLDLAKKFYTLSIRDMLIHEFLTTFDWIKYVDRDSVALKFSLQHKYLPQLINYCGHRGLFINFEPPLADLISPNNPNLPKTNQIIAELTIDDYIKIVKEKQNYVIHNKTKHKINIKDTHQYLAQNMKCVGCGISATTCLLIRQDNKSNSIGIYAFVNESHIRLTIDHVVPKAKNGKSDKANYQTLCTDCNRIKGHGELTEGKIKNLLEKRAEWNTIK